jgi:ABC-2 type transport system permease protein
VIGWMVWRLHRRGLIGFGIGGFLVSFFYGATFLQAAGTTAASQAAFGRSIDLAARQFAFLVPAPVHPETLGGYEQYKWLAGAAILMMLWAGIAGVGVGRGDEERGLTEQWIAAGLSRTRLLLARSAAFGLVLLAVCFASVLGIVAVAPSVHQDSNLVGELEKATAMAAGLFAGYAIALAVSQLPAERQTATALGVGVLVLLLVVNGIADTVDAAAWLGVLSPFHWMNQTTSGAPGGRFDVGATLGLAATSFLLIAATISAFRRRDIGRGLIAPARRARAAVRIASRNLALRWVFSEGLWEQRMSLGAWAVGTMLLGALMVSVTRSMVDALVSDPRLATLFQRVAPGPVQAAFLGFAWFDLALLVLAGYTVVQVSRWSAQDRGGRVGLLLSLPISRARVVVERALEFAIASLIVVVGAYVGTAVAIPLAGLDLDRGRVLAASALLWPFALAFGGLGVAVASRWPGVAVPFLTAFAAVEYFLGDLAPLLRLPAWVANLSVFHLYGNPVADPPSLVPALSLTLVFPVGFVVALALMRRRDAPEAA